MVTYILISIFITTAQPVGENIFPRPSHCHDNMTETQLDDYPRHLLPVYQSTCNFPGKLDGHMHNLLPLSLKSKR